MELDTIYNEDCFVTLERMQDKSVDHVFTSPPYNRKRNDTYELYNDVLDDYLGFLVRSTKEALRVSRGNVFVNIQANYYNRADLNRYVGEFAEEICNQFVWTKANPMPASGNNVTNAYEFIFVLGKGIKSNTTYTKNHIHTGVNPRTDKAHGAIMNQAVSDFFISLFTKPGEVIYDPFMGCGTTALSCRKYGRHFIGSEIIKEYCDIANARLSQTVMDIAS